MRWTMGALTALMVTMGAAADAATVNWTLAYSSTTTLGAPLSANGTFTFDADTGVYSNVSIATDWSGYGTPFFNTARPTNVILDTYPFATTAAADQTDSYVARFDNGLPALTNAGGIISGAYAFFVVQCNNATCTSSSSFGQASSSLSMRLEGVPVTSEVPLPASAVLLLGALAALAGKRSAVRRRG